VRRIVGNVTTTPGGTKKLEELSAELKEKVLRCKTPDELLELAKEEGYTLSDEELLSLSGGGFWDSPFKCSDYTNDCLDYMC